MQKGTIIVIDGMDGTGKQTQSKLLYDKLKSQGKKVHLASFPNYDSDSSYFIKKFLNGEYKNIDNPYLTSLFYSIDRGITFTTELKEKYDQGYIIILDRYYISNVLYQLQCFETYQEKMIYIQYLGIVEVESLKLPMPDITIILSSHPHVSNQLLNKRYSDDDNKRDIYENLEIQNKIYRNIGFIDKYKNIRLLKTTLGKISILSIHDVNGNIYSVDNMHNQIMNELDYL